MEQVTQNQELIVIVGGFLYEFIVRKLRTKKSWSAVNMIGVVFDTVLKNRTEKQGEYFENSVRKINKF